MPVIAQLECARCHTVFAADAGHGACPGCGGPLLVFYDNAALRESAALRRKSMELPQSMPVGGIISPQ
ncbi:MAG: hypothetical protein ACYC46_05420 [Acidobacteriaceae bacterium]